MRPITPPAVIGIVGAGQLGRMLAQVAHRYGYQVAVLTGGDRQTPAGTVADIEVAAEFNDPEAVQRFVACVDVVTWELENVSLDVADAAIATGIPVRPGPRVIAAARDRGVEKEAITSAGVPVAPYREVTGPSELEEAVIAFDAPVIIKTVRGGYDGKYQARVASSHSLDPAGVFEGLGSSRLIVEQELLFDREVSVVVARTADGLIADHGVMENVHVDGILDTTITPADIPLQVSAEAISIAVELADHLDVVGLLCVEMFVVGSELFVNEIAPRPHNSGHCTIEAAVASQFEQHLRAICGLPLGDGACRPAAMAQLLGELWDTGEPDWVEVLSDPKVSMHLYGKREARRGRKMGHLTCVDTTPMSALEQVLAARERIL